MQHMSHTVTSCSAFCASHACFARGSRTKHLSQRPLKAGAACCAQVAADAEVQAWWTEVQEKGHPDKGVGPAGGWTPITDIASLAEALVTIAFTGSAHHAAVNFGQVCASRLSRAVK